jgi:SagB-type dehydrogenase family enzyme
MLKNIKYVVIVLFACGFLYSQEKVKSESVINLPQPEFKGKVSVEEAIKARRTIREFSEQIVTLKELSQLLWCAQGITGELTAHGTLFKLRTVPSAGALYPLNVYVSVREKGVEGLAPGIYKYIPDNHSIQLVVEGDQTLKVEEAVLGQSISTAPITFIITSESYKTTIKYAERAMQYIYIEAGHLGQNLQLQGEAMGFGTWLIGAYWDGKLVDILKLSYREIPVYVIAAGHKKPTESKQK